MGHAEKQNAISKKINYRMGHAEKQNAISKKTLTYRMGHVEKQNAISKKTKKNINLQDGSCRKTEGYIKKH